MRSFLKLAPLTALALLAMVGCSNTSPTAIATSSTALSSGTSSGALSSGSLSSAALSSGALGSSSSQAIQTPQWHTFNADNPKIRTVGRADISIPTRPILAWSGSQVQVAFIGTDVKIHLAANGSIFNVFVDGDTLPTSVLDLSQSSDTVHTIATGLTLGQHVVSVYKRTEAQYGDMTFSGFEILGNDALSDLPAAPAHKIEVIGNSITCGYGDLDTNKMNHFDITTEDHYFTYAAVTSRALNAELHAECYSGRGIYRSNMGDLTGNLPELFPLMSPLGDLPWNFAQWTPEVVLVNLGTNDFYQSIPDSNLFVSAAIAFIDTIHAKYPAATILMLDGPMLSDYFPTITSADLVYPYPATGTSPYYTRKVTAGDTTFVCKSQTVCKRFLNGAQAALVAHGVNAVRMSFPAQTGALGYGADWHPSMRQHAAMAKQLTTQLQTTMGWL